MAYELGDRLVVGVASSALFDLAESDRVFRTEGEESYRKYQEEHLDDPLSPGMAFSFIRRLLSLNDLSERAEDPLIEVIVMSRNDPDTGLRVLKSIEHHGLPITRAVFMQGRAPYKFIPALNICLFLSADEQNVREANHEGFPAGRVLPSAVVDDLDDKDLRIAFDFDGVLADDEAEQVMQSTNLKAFHEHEVSKVVTAHNPGPLQPFLVRVSTIQKAEQGRKLKDPSYRVRLHVSIVTARNAPSHERAVKTLKEWGVMVNDAFFLGGIDKGAIMRVLRPHIFFDDQQGHLESTSQSTPSVHVPFGALNEMTTGTTES